MLKSKMISLMLSLILSGALMYSCQSEAKDQTVEIINTSFQKAGLQYQYLTDKIEVGQYPKTFENGELRYSNSGWWCSGFYPGSMLYIYEQTEDLSFLETTELFLANLEREKNNTTTHDLGFMMYCSFGNANRLDPNPEYDSILLKSSETLAARFDERVGVIRSWDRAPWNSKWQFPVIIDNMMNLEMLLWSAEKFSRPDLKEVAVTHADNTMKNHFRPDFSSYHVVSYDRLSGGVEMKNTDQGYADESSWARGQAWGLYGYTVMYRFTKDQKYLDHVTGIADYLLSHPNLPEDKIPYWDYNDPKIPNAPRDASAGAVMASALLELSGYVDVERSETYKTAAKKMIETLSSDEYTAPVGSNGGFILMHSVGNMPDGTEVDVPLSYADYYYLEAMKRYLDSSEIN